jgi:hypothetical protein
MKARIIQQPAKVYSEMTSNNPPFTELMVGTEVEIGEVKKKAGSTWVTVKIPGDQKGYIPGDTKVFTIKLATLLQNEVEVRSGPSAISTVSAKYKKNTKFYLWDTVVQDGITWVKIKDMNGIVGYIDGKTRIKTIPVISKATGKRNMLSGALWCIGGIVVTAITMSMASSGGTYIVAWGAILFGGIQFIQGLVQFLTSPS